MCFYDVIIGQHDIRKICVDEYHHNDIIYDKLTDIEVY